jgi:hypothetical protein
MARYRFRAAGWSTAAAANAATSRLEIKLWRRRPSPTKVTCRPCKAGMPTASATQTSMYGVGAKIVYPIPLSSRDASLFSVGDEANQVMYDDEYPEFAYLHATLANEGKVTAHNVQGRMEFEPDRVYPERRGRRGGTLDSHITARSHNWATLFLGEIAPNLDAPKSSTLHARSFVPSPRHFVVPVRVAEAGQTRLTYWFVCDEGARTGRTVTLDFTKPDVSGIALLLVGQDVRRVGIHIGAYPSNAIARCMAEVLCRGGYRGHRGPIGPRLPRTSYTDFREPLPSRRLVNRGCSFHERHAA